MCGLTGIFDPHASTTAETLRATVTAMTDTLVHRGPDDAGVWVDPTLGVAFGHRRLSILDLSPAGHQPMASFDGRWQLAYNGEVYNHHELRAELAPHGIVYRGTSDTETLAAGFSVWGVTETLRRCRGIFALAACDTQTGTVVLARDHLGVKPLYYGRAGTALVFGSELKALRAHPAFPAEIDRDVLPLFLRHNYIPAPYSIYRETFKLPAGTILTLPGVRSERSTAVAAAAPPALVAASPGTWPVPQPYWSFAEAARAGIAHPLSGTVDEITQRVAAELARAIREQMLADVPLGAFLSGGIDSSLVVALMQQHSPRPVKTFTIGFELTDYDEAPFARDVARHLRTEHTEHYVTAAEAQAVIPRLPALYDEPFADSSQIPTFLVCQLARQQVTVALSGDGGDELFCGYLRYFAPLVGLRGGQLPAVVRSPAAALAALLGRTLPMAKGRKFCRRAAAFLRDADPDDRYLRGLTHWDLDSGVVLGAVPPRTLFEASLWPALPHRQQRWMWLDTQTYLPDDILVKVDRASMGVALEARVPLLDPRVVELAWRVPLAQQTHGWSGKQTLRRILGQSVPPALFERPKKGFGVPIAEWLRGPLVDWAEALLAPQRLQQDGYFAAPLIREKWQEHRSGRVDWGYLLWDVLMFQAWLTETHGTHATR